MMYTFQRLLVAGSLAVLLASCGGEGPDSTESQIGSIVTEARPLPRELPRGTPVSFPYHFLRDVIREDRPGVFQRRVRVEYLGMGQAEVADAVRQAFTASAYSLNMEKVQDNGALQLNFEHPRMERNVTVTVQEGGELEHADARGIVQFTFPASPPGTSEG